MSLLAIYIFMREIRIAILVLLDSDVAGLLCFVV